MTCNPHNIQPFSSDNSFWIFYYGMLSSSTSDLSGQPYNTKCFTLDKTRSLSVHFPHTCQQTVKLLSRLNEKKASGPDNISCKILQELTTEIAPVLCAIFNQSLTLGELSSTWTKANVSPIFKKGNHHLPANYRPISLTSIQFNSIFFI